MKTIGLISPLLFLLATGHCFATANSDTTLIRNHLTAITKTLQFRTYKNIDQLNKTADYIKTIFNQYSDYVSVQEYSVNGQVYKNVICSFGIENEKRISGVPRFVCIARVTVARLSIVFVCTSIDLPEPAPLCGIQFNFLIMQDPVMDLTAQPQDHTTDLRSRVLWVAFPCAVNNSTSLMQPCWPFLSTYSGSGSVNSFTPL
jgi:hypothetical protein